MKKYHNLSCNECGAKCCRYIALEIDKPTCKRDYDHIRWYLMHGNVNVFIDDEGDWFIEFETDCLTLGKNMLCNNYENRPRICRKYGEENNIECEFSTDTSPHLIHFSKVKEFESYLNKHKIDWKWK